MGTDSARGMLKISDTRFLFMGQDTNSNHASLINVNPTTTTATENWQKNLDIPGAATAIMNKGAAILSSDSSIIYAALSVGDSGTTAPLVFLQISESDGSMSETPIASDQF